MKPVEVTVKENYKLLIRFDNSEIRIFDVLPYISGSFYGKLASPQYFNSVHISGNTVEWADGQDIAPHELREMSVPVNS